ncbi:MAG TPA: hypothetical protein PKL36_12350 [Agitococcus sp.]|nr:hypothetical protein [Agitococcus sp.]
MNTSEGLIPKWDKWLNMIDATDFQLVALSLNYEPPSTLKTITRFQGLLCYAQRLSIIKNHITNKQLPYEQRRCSSTDKFENYVQLNAFVKWAVDVMAWDLPPELLTVYNAPAPVASSQKLIEENELLRQQLSDAQAKIDVLKKQLNEYQEKPIAIKTENKVMPLIYHLCCQLLNNGKPVKRPVQKTLSFITDDLKNKRGIELGSKALDDYYKLGEKIINEKNR